MSELPFSESFLLTLTGSVFAAVGGLLMCVLKSRCTAIKCCGAQCERDVLPPDMVIENNNQNREEQ